jgi:hypothetical protein
MKTIKLQQITTYIDHSQKQWLDKNSYKGKKRDNKDNKPSFSEHIRMALAQYMEREATKCD